MGQPLSSTDISAMESLQFAAIISKMNFSLSNFGQFLMSDLRFHGQRNSILHKATSWKKKMKMSDSPLSSLLHNTYKILSDHAHKIYKSYNTVGRYILTWSNIQSFTIFLKWRFVKFYLITRQQTIELNMSLSNLKW